MRLVLGLNHMILKERIRILRMSSSDTGSKEDRVPLLLLGLVIKTGADNCSAVMTLFDPFVLDLAPFVFKC